MLLYSSLLSIKYPILLITLPIFSVYATYLYLQKKLDNYFVLIFINILLQNFLFAKFSTILAYLLGSDTVLYSAVSNNFLCKLLGIFLLEVKLILFGALLPRKVVKDIQLILNRKKLHTSSLLFYVLLLFLIFKGILSYTEKGFSFLLLGNIRNYISILFAVELGFYLGYNLSTIKSVFNKHLLFYTSLFANVYYLFTIIIIKLGMFEFWNNVLGVRFLYFFKQFFRLDKEIWQIQARIRTQMLGIRFYRTGGIWYEPVNYSYFVIFLILASALIFLNSNKKNDRIKWLLTILANSVIFGLNFGKGGFLFVAITLIIGLIFQYRTHLRPLIVKRYFLILFPIIVFFFVIAPILSSYTEAHLVGFQNALIHLFKDVKTLLFGINLGSVGNFIENGTNSPSSSIRESALGNMLIELGVIWIAIYILYLKQYLTLFYNYLKSNRINSILISYILISLYLLFSIGVFQENIFSLQVSFFTTVISLAILGFASNKEIF